MTSHVQARQQDAHCAGSKHRTSGDAGNDSGQSQGSAANSGRAKALLLTLAMGSAPSGAMLHWSKDDVDALSPLLRRVESIKVCSATHVLDLLELSCDRTCTELY